MARSRRMPPRWFAWALFGGMIVAVAAMAGLGALLYDPLPGKVTIGTRSYIFPAEHLSSDAGDLASFVRIRPPGKRFELVHAAQAAGLRDSTGVPHIFSINDRQQPDLTYHRAGHTLVLCRRASSPAAGCGTWIEYGGAVWSVLFPAALSNEAEGFVREAKAALRGYDVDGSRLLP